MATLRGTPLMITWGPGYANKAYLGYPLDNALSYSEPRAGSEFAMTAAGVEDAWVWGTDYYVSGDVRYVPRVDTLSPRATGWDGPTGVRAMLEWGRAKNPLKLHRGHDVSAGAWECYLTEPATGGGELEQDGTRKLSLKLRGNAGAFEGL